MDDPTRDLTVSRYIAAPPPVVWRCWAEPALFVQWFAPKPVVTTSVQHEFCSGGAFATSLQLPDGTVTEPEAGCFLEVSPHDRIVFSDAMGPGWRPKPEPFFTAVMTLQLEGRGTRYTAEARHGTVEGRQEHLEMGFTLGWAKALDQLGALAEGLARDAA